MKTDKPIYHVPIGGDQSDSDDRVKKLLEEAGISDVGEVIEILQRYDGDLTVLGQMTIKELITRLREDGLFPRKKKFKQNLYGDRP